jgi:hypothetical protein
MDNVTKWELKDFTKFVVLLLWAILWPEGFAVYLITRVYYTLPRR